MKAETDIELCKVTSLAAKEKVMYALMQAGVPYAEKWEKVPVIKRKKFNGAKEVCVVITHLGKADLGKQVVESLEQDILNQVVW